MSISAWSVDIRNHDSLLKTDADSHFRSCKSLVIRDQDDGTIRFAHHTIRQYLLSEDARKRNQIFACSIDEAEHFVGQMCLTYLSFSDFETQVAIRTPESKAQQPPDLLSLGTASWISNLLGVPRALFEVPYRLLGRSSSTPAPSIDYMGYLRPASTSTDSAIVKKLSEKYKLLGYIIDYWMFYTKNINPSERQLSQKLHEIARYKNLSFEFRPWGPNQHHGKYGCVSCAPNGAAESVAKRLPFMAMLHYAAKVGHWPLMAPLISDYCSHESGEDETLVIACRAGHLSIVKQLTQSHTYNISNEKSLIAAGASGNEQIFAYLLDLAPIDYPLRAKEGGSRPLILASTYGYEAIVETLCKRGAQINNIDRSTGENALLAAARNGHNQIVQNLLSYGARSLTTWTTPLHCAAENGHDIVVRTLLLPKSDDDRPDETQYTLVSTLDRDGETPLHKASRNGHHAVVETLLSCSSKRRDWISADARKQPYKHYKEFKHYQGKAVHLAAFNGHVRVLTLLAKHVSFDERDSYRNTPLMIAAREGHLSVARFLLQYAVNDVLIMKNNDGLSVRELAVEGGNENVLKAVLETNLIFLHNDHLTLLILAARKRQKALLLVLVDHFKRLCDDAAGLLRKAQSIVKDEKNPEAAQLLGAILEKFTSSRETRLRVVAN